MMAFLFCFDFNLFAKKLLIRIFHFIGLKQCKHKLKICLKLGRVILFLIVLLDEHD